jgi:hypothetical protein
MTRECPRNWQPAELIELGGSLAAPPLPHHRAYGTVPRRFGGNDGAFAIVPVSQAGVTAGGGRLLGLTNTRLIAYAPDGPVVAALDPASADVAFSPDGRMVATAAGDWTANVILFDASDAMGQSPN